VSPADHHPADAATDGPARVRPYALVGGRTRVAGSVALPVEAIVVSTPEGLAGRLGLEQGRIVALCAKQCSVAELGAHLDLPLGVVRVLVGDLLRAGAVDLHLPLGDGSSAPADRALLERVLAGLEAL
jgi:hypothetical protein